MIQPLHDLTGLPGSPKWYALHIRPMKEIRVGESLRIKGYECLLPLSRCRKLTSKGVSESRRALFPGYLFCRIDLSETRMPILVTPDVLGIVGVAGVPAPIGDDEIAAVQQIAGSRISAEPWPYLQPGMRVRLLAGPLSGLCGVVVQQDQADHLIVSVELLQRSVAVEIRPEWAYAHEPETLGAAGTSACMIGS
jgi:transcription antitermination factor NusG